MVKMAALLPKRISMFFSWLFPTQEQIDQGLLDTGWYFRAKDGKVKPKVIRTGRHGWKAHPEWLEYCVRTQVEKMQEGYRP